MKLSILLLTPLFVFASSNTLTPREHNSIHGYNKNPMLKMKQKRKMHSLNKVDEKMLTKIVKDYTSEDIVDSKLTHRGNYLIYKVTTKSYKLEVNALDGTILKK